MSKEATKKASQPQLVFLDKSSKLAEKWVREMGLSFEDTKSSLGEIEGRPERLGLGAKVPRQSKFVPSSPFERNFQAKIEAEKRKKLKSIEESARSARDSSVDDDDSDEEESKAQSFSKKRPAVLNSLPQGKKKGRK